MNRIKNKSTCMLRNILLIILTMSTLLSAASDGEHGTVSNLSFGMGARALAMGRAYVAAVNDPTAVFWNPAGLDLVTQPSATLFHNQLFEGSLYDFFGFVYPTLTYGTVGLGFARVGTGDVPHTSNSYENLGSLNYEEDELYVSYAKRLPFNIYSGATMKIRRQVFSGDLATDATGIGLDLGLLYQSQKISGIFQDVNVGFNYRNVISPDLKLGSQTDNEPYIMTFGLLKGIQLGMKGKINVALDYLMTSYESGDIRMGSEYLFSGLGALRAGYGSNGVSFGAGLSYSFVDLDYSFGSSVAEELPMTHRFSLTFNFGKTRSQLLEIAEDERLERERELIERTKAEEKSSFITEHMEKGRQYLSEKKYFDAYVEFQQVVSEDPFNSDANALMQNTNDLIQQDLEKRQQEAIDQAINKELAEKDREFFNLHFEKGRVFLQNNQYTDALVEFNLALETVPNDSIVISAIQTTERRLQAQVRNLVGQGREEFQNGNYSGALQILSEALVLSPEDPQLKDEINTLANRIKIQQYIQQALQSFDLGDYQKALNQFEEALKLDPSNERLRQYIERTKRGMGEYEEEMDQESARKNIQAVDLYLARRYEDAIKIWEELLKKYPYNKKLNDNIKNAQDRIKQRDAQSQ